MSRLLALACALSLCACGSPSGDTSGSPPSAPSSTAKAAPGVKVPSAGVELTLPEGLVIDAQDGLLNVNGKDGQLVQQITVFDGIDSAGSYDSAKQVGTLLGAKADWAVDRKNPDGTWALEWTSTHKDGKVVHGINYSYLAKGKAFVCSASNADKRALEPLAALCRNLAPRAL